VVNVDGVELFEGLDVAEDFETAEVEVLERVRVAAVVIV
jgi:hypothetical protein